MERLTLSNNEIHTDIGIWILKNGNPKELISDDCDEYEYFKKLAEYEDLEEQGKLLKLPCAAGDTVYCIRESWSGYVIDKKKFKVGMIDKFNKTVFLTKSDAERALAEMEGKK